MKTINIEGRLRDKIGKNTSKAYRREGFVPGVIYGGEKEVHFIVSQKDFKDIVYTPEFVKVNISIAEQSYTTIVKDLQFDKVTDQLIHVDLLELIDKKPLKATIPLRLVGNAVGVKAGGRLVFKLKNVNVATTPENLKEFIEVDISDIEIGQNVRIMDIKADGIKLLNSAKVPVVGVVTTRVLKQEAATGEDVAKTDAEKQEVAT